MFPPTDPNQGMPPPQPGMGVPPGLPPGPMGALPQPGRTEPQFDPETGLPHEDMLDQGPGMFPERPAHTANYRDRKSTRLNSSHLKLSRMPSSA